MAKVFWIGSVGNIAIVSASSRILLYILGRANSKTATERETLLLTSRSENRHNTVFIASRCRILTAIHAFHAQDVR